MIISDISNPPNKKIKKMKISINENSTNINTNIDNTRKSNDNIIKDRNTLVHNYENIKIDTADELLNKKNEEKHWDEIISLKKKNLKCNNQKRYIPLTSGKNSSTLISTKNNSIKSNDKKSDISFTKTITQNNLGNYNYINLFPSSN